MQAKRKVRGEALRIDDVHFVNSGVVMCEKGQALHTVPAKSIKHPVTQSIKQAQQRQRKMLEGRSICPDCWSALRHHIEGAWMAQPLISGEDEIIIRRK